MNEYDVHIGRKLLAQTGVLAASRFQCASAAVITDDIVNELYAGIVEGSLCEAGYRVCRYAFPHGETHKNLHTVEKILEFLAENHITRTDIIVAVGGGIVGDVAGFCAAVYLRGIRFIQAPTTLLAAVDSSVGGKTGVNLAAGKNLAGAFHQPSYVLCDCDCFHTLSDEIYADGIAEMIKYGVICDEELFDTLAGRKYDIADIIKRCVEIKKDVVHHDEFDKGERQLLNFGHTIGHAVEKCSGYRISHGHAVAIGMTAAAGAAIRLGVAHDSAIQDRIRETLQGYRLPTELPYTIPELLDAMYSDKKRDGGTMTLVLPERIGRCILHKLPITQLQRAMEG